MKKLITVALLVLSTNIYAGTMKEARDLGVQAGQMGFMGEVVCKNFKTPNLNKFLKTTEKKYKGRTSFKEYKVNYTENYNYLKSILTSKEIAKKFKTKQAKSAYCKDLDNKFKK